MGEEGFEDALMPGEEDSVDHPRSGRSKERHSRNYDKVVAGTFSVSNRPVEDYHKEDGLSNECEEAGKEE